MYSQTVRFVMDSTLIDSLQSPACYPHPVDRVERVETHISWVLLAGEFVYKIKKPVNFGFLDFSTLDRREFFCREEVRLNRRHAAKLYLEVVAIGGSMETPELNTDGPAIEYAVRMRRFDPDDGFDRLLADGRLRANHVRDLGTQLARLHENIEVATVDSGFGSLAQVAEPMRDNLTELARLLPDNEHRQKLARLSDWTEWTLARLTPLIEQRRREGFVRECHGDAHLGNVTLYEGRATLFDCIEFSDELRWIDVINDLAFTVMDLHDHGAEHLGWLLLDEYLARSGDFGGLALLDLYVVYRALVRAKVLALQLADKAEPALVADIEKYLALAERTRLPRPPRLVMTMGVSGSGKSWLAERLLQSCGLIRLRSDVERKRLFDLDADASTQLDRGRWHLLGHSQRTDLCPPAGTDPEPDQDRFFGHRRCDVSGTGPARFVQTCLAERLEVPFRLIHCQADKDVLKCQRIKTRHAEGNDPSEAGVAVLERQLEQFQSLTAEELDQALVLDTSADDVLEQTLAWLDAERATGRSNCS
jgi:uncharacterized protein